MDLCAAPSGRRPSWLCEAPRWPMLSPALRFDTKRSPALCGYLGHHIAAFCNPPTSHVEAMRPGKVILKVSSPIARAWVDHHAVPSRRREQLQRERCCQQRRCHGCRSSVADSHVYRPCLEAYLGCQHLSWHSLAAKSRPALSAAPGSPQTAEVRQPVGAYATESVPGLVVHLVSPVVRAPNRQSELQRPCRIVSKVLMPKVCCV
jgi:hypothetical protein